MSYRRFRSDDPDWRRFKQEELEHELLGEEEQMREEERQKRSERERQGRKELEERRKSQNG